MFVRAPTVKRIPVLSPTLTLAAPFIACFYLSFFSTPFSYILPLLQAESENRSLVRWRRRDGGRQGWDLCENCHAILMMQSSAKPAVWLCRDKSDEVHARERRHPDAVTHIGCDLTVELGSSGYLITFKEHILFIFIFFVFPSQNWTWFIGVSMWGALVKITTDDRI